MFDWSLPSGVSFIPTSGQEEEFEEIIKEAKARLSPELPIGQ